MSTNTLPLDGVTATSASLLIRLLSRTRDPPESRPGKLDVTLRRPLGPYLEGVENVDGFGIVTILRPRKYTVFDIRCRVAIRDNKCMVLARICAWATLAKPP
jgi:hypothetical protein